MLVLDDAQLVQNEEAWGHVALVLENLPEGAQIAVATRSEPPLALGRLRARGELLELRFAELAFDRDEASSLLRLHAAGEGHAESAAGPDAVGALLEATEGWATGLYLASLTARGRSPEEWLAEVRGDQRAIADYLLGEVLERQPADLQRFLLETSILDELTAPVCAAVTGRADSGAVLARLARENLFVSAIDDHDERFRYHHLFADLLRSRLERDEPGVVAELHRRAAAWYEAHASPSPPSVTTSPPVRWRRPSTSPWSPPTGCSLTVWSRAPGGCCCSTRRSSSSGTRRWRSKAAGSSPSPRARVRSRRTGAG